MTYARRSHRFVPITDILPLRLTPGSVEVCPMDPVLIDYRLPENHPFPVDPMAPLQNNLDSSIILAVRSTS